jgi:hypothetical protein
MGQTPNAVSVYNY